jgi:hypothetical protein
VRGNKISRLWTTLSEIRLTLIYVLLCRLQISTPSAEKKKRSHGVSNGASPICLLHTGQFFDFFHPNAIFLLLF